MAYDDVIRVADLKTRGVALPPRREGDGRGRRTRCCSITEFMHPRIEEVCGTMPARIGAFILARPKARRARSTAWSTRAGTSAPTRSAGSSCSICSAACAASVAARSAIAPRRRIWRSGWRWPRGAAGKDYALGVEVLRARRLIKGYSDTHARGESKYDRVLSALPLLTGRPDAAEWLHRLIEAALKDEKGEMLDGALKTITDAVGWAKARDEPCPRWPAARGWATTPLSTLRINLKLETSFA